MDDPPTRIAGKSDAIFSLWKLKTTKFGQLSGLDTDFQDVNYNFYHFQDFWNQIWSQARENEFQMNETGL